MNLLVITFVMQLWYGVESNRRSGFICQGRVGTITCNKRTKISIIRASYGRSDERCGLGYHCPLFTVSLVLEDHCNCKRICKLSDFSRLFENRCLRNRNYLEVTYECVPSKVCTRQPSTITATTTQITLQPTQKLLSTIFVHRTTSKVMEIEKKISTTVLDIADSGQNISTRNTWITIVATVSAVLIFVILKLTFGKNGLLSWNCCQNKVYSNNSSNQKVNDVPATLHLHSKSTKQVNGQLTYYEVDRSEKVTVKNILYVPFSISEESKPEIQTYNAEKQARDSETVNCTSF